MQEELQRFDTAKRLAKQQLLEALRRLSDNQAASELIQVQEMLLDDTEFSQAVRDQIDSGHCAGQAVTQAAASLADFFRAMDDSYMAARASDFLDIANRLLDCMHENAGPAFSMERPCILVAEELLPSQTLSLDRSKLLGIVTATGSFQSHAAILARSMGIPAITGLDIATIDDGQMLLLDGCHGTLTIDPDPERYTKFCSEQKNHQSHQAELRRSAFDPAVSADGVRVEVCANIGVLDDITDDTVRCADGVGLFRSEFLYLAHQDYPDEQTQFEAYKYALQRFAPKRVVIRTMDIGADKKVPYFSLPQEDNPALGYRALRICLDRRDIFRTQLRALLRASNYGNLAIMIPMVTKVEEVFQVKTLQRGFCIWQHNCKAALKRILRTSELTKPTKIPLTIATIMPPEPSALKLTLKMPSTICGSMIMMKRASPAKPACLRVWRRCFFSIMEYGIKKARKSEIRLNEKFAKPLQDGKLGNASLMVSRMVPMVPMKIIGIVVRIASCTAATYGFLAARFIFGAKTSDIHCMNFFIGSPPFQIQFS